MPYESGVPSTEELLQNGMGPYVPSSGIGNQNTNPFGTNQPLQQYPVVPIPEQISKYVDQQRMAYESPMAKELRAKAEQAEFARALMSKR